MSKYLLSIDQGTTGTKVLLVDHDGHVKATSYREHTQYYPKSGWVEHSPSEIWEKVRSGVQEVMDSASIEPSQIEAVGLDNQGETVMFWDGESGRPLDRAIVWSDRRSTELTEYWKSQLGWPEKISEKTGLLLDPYFSATKIRWLMEHSPEVKTRLNSPGLKCGTLDAWLIWKMTNGRDFKTDPSTAGRTLLYNIHTKDWDEEILDYLEIKRHWLPEVSPTVGNFGTCDSHVFCGIEAPIKVSLVDQPAALYGHLCTEPGSSKCTFGTGCFCYMNVGSTVKVDPQGRLLSSIVWERNNETTYSLDGSIYSAGSAVNWGSDALGLYKDINELQKWSVQWLEQSKDRGFSHSLFFVPSLGGIGAPYWNPEARSLFIGMSYDTTKEDMARAILEGIAHRVTDVMEVMENTSGLPTTSLKVDGGLTNNPYLMQFQADILGVPVEVPEISETTAIGVAYLLGEACGWWGEGELQERLTMAKQYLPRMPLQNRKELRDRWREAVGVVNEFYGTELEV